MSASSRCKFGKHKGVRALPFLERAAIDECKGEMKEYRVLCTSSLDILALRELDCESLEGNSFRHLFTLVAAAAFAQAQTTTTAPAGTAGQRCNQKLTNRVSGTSTTTTYTTCATSTLGCGSDNRCSVTERAAQSQHPGGLCNTVSTSTGNGLTYSTAYPSCTNAGECNTNTCTVTRSSVAEIGQNCAPNTDLAYEPTTYSCLNNMATCNPTASTCQFTTKTSTGNMCNTQSASPDITQGATTKMGQVVTFVCSASSTCGNNMMCTTSMASGHKRIRRAEIYETQHAFGFCRSGLSPCAVQRNGRAAGHQCYDLSQDVGNCGACRNDCSLLDDGEGSYSCIAGKCVKEEQLTPSSFTTSQNGHIAPPAKKRSNTTSGHIVRPAARQRKSKKAVEQIWQRMKM